MTGRVRWGRVIGLALALEAALFAALVPIQPLLSLRVWFVAVAIGCTLFSYVAGRLAARGLPSGAVLNGLFVGVLATIIYIALCMLGPGGLPAAVAAYGAPLYVLLNVLRVAGCVVGAIAPAGPTGRAAIATNNGPSI
jgi:hypothetical protein